MPCRRQEREGRQLTELAVHHLRALPRRHVPQPQRPVAGARAEQLLLQGVKPELLDCLLMPCESYHFCFAFNINNDNIPVHAATHDHGLLLRADHAHAAARHLAFEQSLLQRLCTPPVHDSPQSHLAIGCNAANVSSSRIKLSANDFVLVAFQCQQTFATFCVPQSQCVIRRTGAKHLPQRAENDVPCSTSVSTQLYSRSGLHMPQL
mmetsp:Transcript_35396/g.71498  ORF Transcript_35396/g.71498 Transcript_35396/m.71498 type:complete len:207 (-) Transcript_35396:64-684(-)